jgi:glycosyltransferase involved in cell wall biosynthesis
MGVAMKLSIVTALKDGFADFARTIPTILAQEGADFEWLIIDDGSRRPVSEQFSKLAADERVRIFRNESGQGQTRSLNLGIREATGKWIVRMDGDDLARLDRLALTRAAILNNPEVQLIFSDYSVIDDDDRKWATVKLRPLGPRFFDYLLHQNNPICHPTVTFRRERADGSLRLYREDLVNAQDYALWKKVHAEAGVSAFEHIQSPLVSYRIARESLSGARAREQREELLAIREGRSLEGAKRTQPLLGEAQKQAMQAYRLLFYRFSGHASRATLTEEFDLLQAVVPLPAKLPKAFFYWAARPLRSLLLKWLLGGIFR